MSNDFDPNDPNDPSIHESQRRLKRTHHLIESKGWQYESWSSEKGFCFASIKKQPYERGPQLNLSDIVPVCRYYIVAESIHEAAKRLFKFV